MPLASPVFWFILVVGVIATGISKSGFAGSMGVITVPLLSLVIPIEQAAALMLPVLIVMDIKVIHYYYRYWDRAVLLAVLPAAVLGIGLGGWAMEAMPAHWLQGMLGGVCLLFASWHRFNQLLGRIPGAGWVWGATAGFTSTLIHAGGPPISIYFAGRQMAKLQWLANAAFFFGLLNIIKIVPYSYLGLWQPSTLLVAVALVPVAWLGVWLGRLIQQRFSDGQFLRVSRLLIFVSGLMLLYKALF